MVSDFYRRRSTAILLFCIAVLPLLTMLGELVPSNNDIETWLPRSSKSRIEYDEFCRTFGAEETILVAFAQPFPEPQRFEALSKRLQGLDEVTSCWTRQQIADAMVSNSVEPDVAHARLISFLATPDDELETMLVSINPQGVGNRQKTVAKIREQLDYCQLENAILAGGPIVANQLDHLGSRKRAVALFGCTLLICLCLLRINIGCWKTSGALMLANVLCIELTMATLWALGMEMNFVMSSLPVMVMVFTTAAAIHYIGHYRHEFHHRNATGRAMAAVIRPSAFATLTTIIGLISLAASDIGPIPAFGRAAAVGTLYSFVIGVLLTPAVLVALKYSPPVQDLTQSRLQKIGVYVLNRPWRVMLCGTFVTGFCAIGVYELRSRISPLDFLPDSDPVLQDTLLIRDTLTSPTSIEAVIDFGNNGSSFVERLREVRRIEEVLANTDNICHVLTLADFFPAQLSEGTFSLSRLASASSGGDSMGSLMADGSRLWRVSMRLNHDDPSSVRTTIETLRANCADMPVTFTGLAPLLEEAQVQIFDGFWKSFASAFVLITVVMMLALRSVSSGLVAMIPNLTPILLVFGLLGWADYPIDIGIMMTASIALGLAVDGTFHFLFSYRDVRNSSGCRYRAVRRALFQTGMPIVGSAVISGCGLLALGLSPFKPTMRFGVLMFTLLLAALVGDLLLLPAFLACGARRKRTQQAGPSEVPVDHRAAA